MSLSILRVLDKDVFPSQASILCLTVFVVYKIPCRGPIAWCFIITLLQGEFSLPSSKFLTNFSFRLCGDLFWIFSLHRNGVDTDQSEVIIFNTLHETRNKAMD